MTSTPKSNDELRIYVAEEALRYLGIPYKFGATLDEAPNCFDCSSFTKYLYAKIGIELPRRSLEQAAVKEHAIIADFLHNGKTKRIDPEQSPLFWKPGDLLFMRGIRGNYRDSLFDNGKEYCIGHVAMYLGDGMAINARSPQGVRAVSLRVLQQPWPKYKIILVKRVLL